jgi:oxygen-independent coproporphyrinogen-3 oxidase
MRGEFRALYVHVPFCAAKCDYCAFYSIPAASTELRSAYLVRVSDQLAEAAGQCAALTTVYVGGGTPSVLTPDELDALLTMLHAHVSLAEGAEFTVECNPESLTPDKVAILARHGVNRVSLGVQSFEPRLRAVIGRRTSLAGLDEALAALRAGGIGNIGMDLIYAIPGETLEDWRADLRRACEAGVRHLSTYELTVEEGTRLGKRQRAEGGGQKSEGKRQKAKGKRQKAEGKGDSAEELAVAMWEAAEEVAGEFGLRRYEVSNLAQPGFECRHNDAVWHGATYLGVGPAASSFDGEVRWTNPADLGAWLAGAPPVEDPLPPEARAAEVLGFGLRTVRGWAREEFLGRTGFDYAELRRQALAELAADGLLEMSGDVLRPTRRGLLFADRVARRLL